MSHQSEESESKSLESSQAINDIKNFLQVFNTDNEDECINLISEDPDTLKIQLQIALDVYTKDHTPWHKANKKIRLQKELIDKIEDKAFLNSALRDFIFARCNCGQNLCENAVETVQLLIDAGADPNEDHFDVNYHSPGEKDKSWNDGCTLYDEVSLFSFGPIYNGKPILDILNQVPKQKINNPPDILLRNLINTVFGFINPVTEDNDRKNIQRAKNLAKELINHLDSLQDISQLFLTVEAYYPNLEQVNDDDPVKMRMLEAFRSAEGFILEAAYQNERLDEHRLLRIVKISLIFSPLILPLIITGIAAILYAKKNPKRPITSKNQICHWMSLSAPNLKKTKPILIKATLPKK